jgi:hypothetical protein
MNKCAECGGTNTVYQAFSGGREYYCPDCGYDGPYEIGDAPRRVQMIADGKFDELREEMHKHLDEIYGEG